MPERSHHMSPEEFRTWGHQAVDWLAAYMERVEDLPVLSPVSPGELREALPARAPDEGEPFEAIMADLEAHILPGITHWQSPNFFAYFPTNTSGPSILGELLAAGLGVQGMLWATSPACTELETHVLDWLVEAMDLPPAFSSEGTGGGVLQDSASSSALCALLAARERATDGRSNRTGVPPGLVAYTSTQAHSSLVKAARIAGIGSDNLRLVEVDGDFAMSPRALEQQLQADLDAGLTPFFVCATVGTTSSHAVDPIAEIAAVCQRHEVWLHVDGAMSGTAALLPEQRHLLKGLEAADSFCFNAHKWLFTNFDCCCFWVQDRAALIGALGILPEYLKNRATESGAVIDYRDWQVPLGRRFRALKLWMVLRHYGLEGLRHHLRAHIELTRELAGWIEQHDDFVLLAPVPLNLVCFAHRGGDGASQALLERLNASGALYLTHTRLNGRYALRLCVGQTHTTRAHVRKAWERICREAGDLPGVLT